VTSSAARRKRPWLAAGLSLIPGLGQIYNGQLAKGFLLLLVTGLTFWGVTLVPLFFWPAIRWPLLFLIPLYFTVLLPALVIYSVFDAYFYARRRELPPEEAGSAGGSNSPVAQEPLGNASPSSPRTAEVTLLAGELPPEGSERDFNPDFLPPRLDRVGLFWGIALVFVGLSFLTDRLCFPLGPVFRYWTVFLGNQVGFWRALGHWFQRLWPLILILTGLQLLRRRGLD